ncbi:hypothetical protein AHF37_04403 [Paragonimus kellicotti]|nr:hypothetical protein AHF37_04403 [Paragonimus kellicotti]
MAAHKLFPGDFVFNSNDSLDTQITASIDRGDFHLSVLSLLVLIVWSIYIMFYNSRILGLVVSLLARRFVRNGYIRFGSISFSALGGKLMLRDFAYMTSDYTVRCCYVIVVFNYWTQFVPGSKEGGLRTGNRCLYVYLYGFDLHMYNRTSVYDELQKLFKEPAHSRSTSIRRSVGDINSTKAVRESLTRKRSIRQASSVDSSDEDPHHSDTNLSSSSFMDLFWSHAHRLIPAIKFNLELTKMCAGNHLLPRACMLSCTRLVGCYTREEPTYQSDKYQHKISADFVNLLCSLIPVSEYAGQHAIEEPPKSWDRTFHVFHFGRGMLTYIQDEPEILWRFFFPSSYEPAQISVPPSHGQPRVARKFVVEVKTATNIDVNVVFVSHGRNQSMQLVALSDSSIKLSVPWLIEPDGMRTTFRASLVQGNLVAQHLWPDVLQTGQLDLDLYLFYPREWNTPHQWDINIKAKNPRLTMLFDYKRFFKGLIEDWARGSHPDLLCFVPCTYTFRVIAENLDFILLANDYNWVSAAGENAHIAFSGKRFNLSFDLPFVDFLPDVVSLIYAIEGFSATLRLSLPETSTMLHVLREMHSRLRLVSRSGGSLSTNPFELHDEALSANLPTGSSVRRHWIDCGRAQSLTLRIGYVYHPSPWTAEHWRFVPVELRPEWPMAKSAAQPSCSRRRHHDRKAHLSSLYHPNSDSSSQSELEELALRGLRPEGSQTHGPTEAQLLESKFDVAYLAPDTVDVHLHIPNSQLCFYGALLRHFIHLKENYFGFCQKPVDFAKSPVTGEEYLLSMMGLSSLSRGRTQETSMSLAASERVDLKQSKDQAIVDPRDYRPLMVRLSLEFHNVQVHLPMHCSSSTAPCPTAFLDCIGFEMDKRWHETKIQLLFSPILLCIHDHPKPPRPKSSSALSRGCIQLMGLCLRGQGMFSHAMLPLDAETLEYAWLLELTAGQLTGQLTAPQLAIVVRALNSFAFTMIDAENQLVRSYAFELCQHARPQALCPLRPTVVPKMLCPGESLLKYRFIRVSLDGLDMGIVETGSCLSIQLDPVRLTNCNMHGTARCNGLFILFPGVRLKQYIRSTSESDTLYPRKVC